MTTQALVEGISPAAQRGLPQYTTKFGKFPRIPVNRISNTRAMDTLKNTSNVPTYANSAKEYMEHVFSGPVKKLDEGAHGAVYLLHSKTHLNSVFDRLSNKIVLKPPRKIPQTQNI